ncbi:Mediator of RNA polymerase II transcription subunit 6 [Apophysomyces ossiformis]|uniref:Mediator of RNA polymerase II transcription subunit 6 n=1 Tax=Apophysomyces ossiformis TaxID=679940 RepID=A0A8H7BG42_9FUNG|nr:Mediator of RNA polymerase II transcription subunit 6 [Apophysomyces ossiformis]
MQRMTTTEDLTNLEWRDTNWLEHVGGFQNQQMVLDYFAMSPFWDRQCNNQILSMQTQYNDLRQSYEATVEALRKMTGIEFAVVHDHPPVWVIQKRYRRGPALDDVNPIATYYIMGANVYQSPTIYSVIANRLIEPLKHQQHRFHRAVIWNTVMPKQKANQMDQQQSRHLEWCSKEVQSEHFMLAPKGRCIHVGYVEDTTGKRQRKKTEDSGPASKRKKKVGKQP